MVTDTRAELERARADARARLATASGAALLVAGLALVVAVLPAEFGVDPTGIGRRLGLLALADVKQQLAAFQAANGEGTASGAVAGAATQTVVAADKPLQHETVEFSLAPGEFIEYKYRLDRGQSLVYNWQASTSVNVEFHAEPDGAPRGYAETYEKQAGVQRAAGTLHAPFSGIHGWYWENTSNAPATVALTSSGFYTLSHEFRKDKPTATKTFR